MAERAYSARELLEMEYGSSRNLLTPHRVAIGKLDRTSAYELSAGEGIEPGSRLYGVSVVRLVNRKTERDYEESCAFSTLAAANAHIEELRSARGALQRCRRAWSRTAQQLELVS